MRSIRPADHDTLAAFRRRFLDEIKGLFEQVLLLAREMGVLKLGTVALDGTKIRANASRHSALSYEHAGKIEAQLKAEVAALMAKAEAADQADLPDGFSIPEELARREERLGKLAEARAKIEARAKERHAREQADYEAKLAARQAKEKKTGKKPGGKPPSPPAAGPSPSDQINLTDEASRIMPVAGGGFEQCYNAQAVVAAGSLLVVAAEVVQAPNDKQQLGPMIDKLSTLPAELGRPETLLADSGYFSGANVETCGKAGLEPLIAQGRQSHYPPLSERLAEVPPPPAEPTPVEAMAHRLQTPRRQEALCLAQADGRAGVRHHQVRAGLPAVLDARPRQGSRRVDPRDHGLEPQAHVRPAARLIGRLIPVRSRSTAPTAPKIALYPRTRRFSVNFFPHHADRAGHLVIDKVSPTGC